MASTGQKKHEKYFKGIGEVEVKARGSKGSLVPVYESIIGRKIKDHIEDGTTIKVNKTIEYNKRYSITYEKNHTISNGYIGDSHIGKPGLDVEINRLTASDFISLGYSIEHCGYSCKMFNSPYQLKESIIQGLNTNNISKQARTSITSWLDGRTSNIQWNGTSDVEINKIGVYLGELLIGLQSLEGCFDSRWNARTKEFIIPTDTSFSGIDSFLILDNDNSIPISSKYGVGASASFFSNLMIHGITNRKELPNCVYTDIIDSALNIGVTKQHLEKKRKSKEILYEYGIRNVLNLDYSQVKNSYAVYRNIKYGKSNLETELTMEGIRSYQNVHPKIIECLGKSTTSFFSRTIAERLMRDEVSMDLMREILVGKELWQSNMDIGKWSKGEVCFNLTPANKAKLTIVGNKSAIDDISGSQGMVSYKLTL